MKKYNIEGYTPAREGGKEMVGSMGPYYVHENGHLIQIVEPTPSKLSKNVKYSKITYTKPDGSKKSVMNHLIVAETFLGTKGEWLANEAGPPPFLIEKVGKEAAQKEWDNASPLIKESFGLEAVQVDHKNNKGDDFSLKNLAYMYGSENREKG
tara:strand:- start:39 stop:497 length:459 start_codon:yes stop_codon:yes gene_type:complete